MPSGNIKGITIKLAADASEFKKALSSTQSDINKTSRSLRQVENALRFNPGNMQLLGQKAKLLEKNIADTKTQLSSMRTELARLDAKGVSKTSEEYMSLEREIIKAESKLKHFNDELLKVKAAMSPLGQLGTKFKQTGEKATELGQKVRGLSMAAAAVTGAISALTVKAGKWADSMNTLSKQTGIGTRNLQVYAGAAELVDVPVESLAKGMVRLGKNISSASKGTGASADAFEKLGVSVKNSDGSLKSQSQMFTEILPKLKSIKNETERNAIANQLFGRSYAQLNPLITDGGKAYADFVKTLEKSGIEIVDQKTLDRANQFNDTIDRTKAVATQAFMSMGSQMASYLLPAMEKITDGIDRFLGKITQMSPKALSAIAGISAGVAGLAPTLLIFGKLSTAMGGAMSQVALLATKFPKLGAAVKGVMGLLSANPIIAIVAGFAALTLAVNALGIDMSGLSDKIADFVVGFADKATQLIPAFINALLSALPKLINSASTIIIALVNGLVKALPKLAAAAPQIISSIANAIASNLPAIISAGVTATVALAKGLIKALPQLKSAAKSIIKALPATMKAALSGMASVGKAIVQGLWKGMSASLGWIKGMIRGWVGSVKTFLKNLFGIHSPSRWARDVLGKNIAYGIGVGFENGLGSVESGMSRSVGRLQSGLQSSVGAMAYNPQRAIIPSTTSDSNGIVADAINALSAAMVTSSTRPATPIKVVTYLGGAKVGEEIVKLYDHSKLALG